MQTTTTTTTKESDMDYEELTRFFPVTAETVTDESGHDGDTADRGYLDFCGRLCDDRDASLSWDFRSLVDLCKGYRPDESDGGDPPAWLSISAGNDDLICPSGAWAFADDPDVIAAAINVHRPDWITDASWRRVCRSLGWKPWAETWARVGPAVQRADAALAAAKAQLATA
jgi:hypothetical protein